MKPFATVCALQGRVLFAISPEVGDEVVLRIARLVSEETGDVVTSDALGAWHQALYQQLSDAEPVYVYGVTREDGVCFTGRVRCRGCHEERPIKQAACPRCGRP